MRQNINYAVSGSFVAPLVSFHTKYEKEKRVLMSRREVVERVRKAVLQGVVE
jgi:hypothetical protein